MIDQPCQKWTAYGRWSPDGLILLDRFNQVVIDYGPKLPTKPRAPIEEGEQ